MSNALYEIYSSLDPQNFPPRAAGAALGGVAVVPPPPAPAKIDIPVRKTGGARNYMHVKSLFN